MNDKKGKYDDLKRQALELREASVENARNTVMKVMSPQYNEFILKKLNENVFDGDEVLNENIYEQDEESELDKLLQGEEEGASEEGELGGEPEQADMATGELGNDTATNDVSTDELDLGGELGGEEGEGEAEDDQVDIDITELLSLSQDDVQELDDDKVREILDMILDAYQNDEIVIPEDDADVSLEIPETGEEGEDVGGLEGDETGELDAILSGEGGEEGEGNDDELQALLSDDEDEEDDEAVKLESKLQDRKKRLVEKIRKNKALAESGKVLLQDEDENLDEEAVDDSDVDADEQEKDNKKTDDTSMVKESQDMTSELKAKIRKKLLENREKVAETEANKKTESKKVVQEDEEKSNKNELREYVIEYVKKKQRLAEKRDRLQKKIDGKSDKELISESEKIKMLEQEKDILKRRLKRMNEKIKTKDEEYDKLKEDVDNLENYTLRYNFAQKLFTNNPLVKQMNENQRRKVLDVLDTAIGLPKEDAKKKLRSIYRMFMEETRAIMEEREALNENTNGEERDTDRRNASKAKRTRKPLDENRKERSEKLNRSRRKKQQEARPIMEGKTQKSEDETSETGFMETSAFKRMMELGGISENDE